MALSEYTFVTTDLLSGNVISQVNINSGYWKNIYKSPGSGLFTIKMDDPTATRANFRDWASALWCIKDGVIKWGGIIGTIQRRGTTRVLTIPVIGFMEYLNFRHLRNAQAMSYGQLLRVSDIEWRDVDPFNIFKDCIDHVQSFPDGNIHLGVEWFQLSGHQVTSVIRTFTVKKVGTFLVQLSNRLDTGFDFEQVYHFDGNNPRCNFRLTSPAFSRGITDTLLFQPERKATRSIPVINAFNLNGTGPINGGNFTNITGDMQIIAQLKMPDWTSGSDMTIRQKWGAAGNRSYKFQLLGDGKLKFIWTADGTTELSVTSDAPVSFANNAEGLVWVTIDVDNGAGNYAVAFFESTNGGTSWTALNNPPSDLFGDTFGDTF